MNEDSLIYCDPKVAFDKIGGLGTLSIPISYLQELDRSSQKLTDNSYVAKIDYELSFKLGSINGKLKPGGKYRAA